MQLALMPENASTKEPEQLCLNFSGNNNEPPRNYKNWAEAQLRRVNPDIHVVSAEQLLEHNVPMALLTLETPTFHWTVKVREDSFSNY